MDRIRYMAPAFRPQSLKRDVDTKAQTEEDSDSILLPPPHHHQTTGYHISSTFAPSRTLSLSSRSASKLSLITKPSSDARKSGRFSSLVDRLGTASTKLPSVQDKTPLVTSWGMARPEKSKSDDIGNEQIEKHDSLANSKIKNVLTQLLMEKRQKRVSSGKTRMGLMIYTMTCKVGVVPF